jgi:hypothetical protein
MSYTLRVHSRNYCANNWPIIYQAHSYITYYCVLHSRRMSQVNNTNIFDCHSNGTAAPVVPNYFVKQTDEERLHGDVFWLCLFIYPVQNYHSIQNTV